MEGGTARETGQAAAGGPRVALFPVLLCLAFGCQNCELVEAELRTRERELRITRERLAQSTLLNQALLQELQSAKQGCPPTVSAAKAATPAPLLKEVVLGRQTGGYDNDGLSGDEALQVVLEPRDLDGRAVAAPGTLHVSVLEIGAQGLKTPLSNWELSADELRPTWRRGLLNTGYHVVLPWKMQPAATRLRVVARFTLPDGAAFEADRDVTVRLPRGAGRGPTPADDGPIMLPAPSRLPQP